ncbi:helix-turn-helix domain-containing protein [Lacticaseibacillus kribbianus]|uniref:helix-turn-helix domain-containing protein n=1 Tax=Lacticaseibacillus kribbianus TaxID=2926292 RepID=UPI001CD2B7A3|nr:helix-turn-helix transcriptional regulator [Lacticaseibacillus kribbianus]
MTEAIAYRLKQIMTAEHLSLTQAAKLIGISPSSMRKVLKDTPMSRPIMFKINRFIEGHPVEPADRHSFTIFDSEAAEAKAEPSQAASTPAAPKPAAKTQPKQEAKPAKQQSNQASKQAAQSTAKTDSETAPAAKRSRRQTAAKKDQSAESNATQAPKSQTKSSANAEKQNQNGNQAKAAKQTKNDNQPKAAQQAKNDNQAKAAKQTKGDTQAKAAQQTKNDNQAKAAKQTKNDNQAKAAKQTKNDNQAKTAQQNKNDSQAEAAKQSKGDNQPKAAKQTKSDNQTETANQTKANTQAKAAKQTKNDSQAKGGRRKQSKPAANPVGSLEPGAQQANFAATRQAQLADQGVTPAAPVKAETQTAPAKQVQDAKQTAKPQADKPAAKQPTQQNQKQQQAAPQVQQTAAAPAQPAPTKPAQSQPQTQQQQAKQPQPQAQQQQPKQPQPQAQQQQPKQPQPQAQQQQPKQPQQAPAPKPAPKRPSSTTLQVFMDESFGGGSDYQRNMSIGATVIDPADDHALDSFMNTLYPFGWQPGDEVKARGKSSAQIQAMLSQALDPAAKVYTIYSPLSDAGNFSMSFGVMYPYVAALLRIIEAQPVLPQKVRVTLDQRSEIATEQLGLAARMLHAYLKSETGREMSFFFRTADSKNTIGVQYSDFASHAAMFFTKAQMEATGMVRLADIGSELGDQLTLYAMVGLQKYLLDERPTAVVPTSSFKSPVLGLASRLFNLASKAATMTQVPDDAYVQAKLVINQLLTIVPSSINGAINKMPFQNWYDMAARASSLLHYTDETLPQFAIDQDALKIAEDALNNVATLLAGGR